MIIQRDNRKGLGKPEWLKRRLPSGPEYERLRSLLKDHRLTTVCREAQCPNQFECYAKGTATFMILGKRCTRNCRFCAVEKGNVGPPDPQEADRVAEAVQLMGLRYAVVTSVTRDDLSDGGAAHFAATIRAIKMRMPATLVEVLIPDLKGDRLALEMIINAGPDVVNHNMETVPRLYQKVRPEAVYRRSLDLLRQAKQISSKIPTKTGFMVGLGETGEELFAAIEDVLTASCDILTIGQYLQPSSGHLPVERFIPPDEFQSMKDKAYDLGFAAAASGPFVRSSYQAEKLYRQASARLLEKH
jgi:lipoyl synthase